MDTSSCKITSDEAKHRLEEMDAALSAQQFLGHGYPVPDLCVDLRWREEKPPREATVNAALSDLRTQRRREKAQYQGAPFADVFQVELILSEEDSDRACIVDVGDTGMSYVIP